MAAHRMQPVVSAPSPSNAERRAADRTHQPRRRSHEGIAQREERGEPRDHHSDRILRNLLHKGPLSSSRAAR